MSIQIDNTGELTWLYFFHFQILRPESGWYAIPLKSLLESSQVKKAYQKARLCLHPDKLQQRGATLLQKYVAEKAFSILQVCKIYKPYIKILFLLLPLSFFEAIKNALRINADSKFTLKQDAWAAFISIDVSF